MCASQDHFIFLTLLIMSMIFVPPPFFDPAVGPYVLLCDVPYTSFNCVRCGSMFALCLFGECPGICTIGGRSHELYTCLFR